MQICMIAHISASEPRPAGNTVRNRAGYVRFCGAGCARCPRAARLGAGMPQRLTETAAGGSTADLRCDSGASRSERVRLSESSHADKEQEPLVHVDERPADTPPPPVEPPPAAPPPPPLSGLLHDRVDAAGLPGASPTPPPAPAAQRVLARIGAQPVRTGGLLALRRAIPAPRLGAQPDVVRRQGGDEGLTSDTVMTGLRSLPIVESKLGETLAQGPTGLEHVKRALALFDKHLALKVKSNAFVNEAIRIATVIDATAAELARSINDPTLKGQIAKELIAAYRTELSTALSSTTDDDERTAQTGKALDLAQAMVGSDPVALFMTEKMKLEDAAWRIREMAVEGKVGPFELFRTLRSRFEMEIGSHSLEEVQGGRKKKDMVESEEAGITKTGESGFELAELIGEISPTFYQRVVDTSKGNDSGKKSKKPKKPTPTMPKWTDDGLSLSPAATQELASLEKAVLNPELGRVTLSDKELTAEKKKSSTALNDKQAQHFSRLRGEEEDTAGDYEGQHKSPRDFVLGKFQSRYNIQDPSAAGTLVDGVLKALETVPLTLTSKMDNLFKERGDKANLPLYGSQYKSEPSLMQEEVDVSDLVGKKDRKKKAKSIGRPDANFAKTRGDNYLRWRRDKDERETGFHGLDADDLPVFAAVNPNFNETKGGNANLAQWDTKSKAWTGTTYGENYYGDVHMLLKDSVRARSTLIARGKQSVQGRRIERLDLTFLLADMCRLFMYDYVDALVASIKKPGTVVLTNMDAEVHIYGGFDVAKDVQAFYLQPAAFAATDGAAGRCKEFAKDNGIRVEDIGKKPATYDITAQQGLQGGIDLKT
jgi:hypothetical protein